MCVVNYSLGQLVAEVDEVLSTRREVFPQQGYNALQVCLDSGHVTAVVSHTLHTLPRCLAIRKRESGSK